VLRDRRAWIAVVAGLSAAGSWYALREAVSPGYLAAVLANEGMRYVETIEGHTRSWLFFPRQLAAHRFVPWALLLPVAWLLLLHVERRLAWWAACVGGAFLALIETAETKLPWYDLPVLPILALVLGKAGAIALRHGLALLRPARPGLVAAMILATFFGLPLAQTAHDAMSLSSTDDPRLAYGEALRSAGPSSLTVLDGGIENSAGFRNYNAVLRFHAMLERAKGSDIVVVHPGHRFAAGETFLTCDPEALAWAGRTYVLSSIGASGGCRTLRVDAEAEPARSIQKKAEAEPWIQDARPMTHGMSPARR
jgi:hypothetical protein